MTRPAGPVADLSIGVGRFDSDHGVFEMAMRMKEHLPCKPAGRGTDRDSARASAAPSEWSTTVALLLATTEITAAVTTYVGTTLV